MTLLENINNRIAERTNYGIRKEIAKEKGYILNWSNGSKRWNAWFGCPVEEGQEIDLDANQVFVMASKKEIEEVIDKLDMLPLYINSFEARFGGIK
jgi:hypothetical protein